MVDFYIFEEDFKKGQFGIVKLENHRLNEKKLAIKFIYNKDMESIEIY
jgi:hypothetical protein